MPQTATNPQTGERLILANGQWVPLTQTATNPQTGERLGLAGDTWVPIGVAPTAAPGAAPAPTPAPTAAPTLLPQQREAMARREAERGFFGRRFDALMGNEIEAPRAYTPQELATRQREIPAQQEQLAARAAEFDRLGRAAASQYQNPNAPDRAAGFFQRAQAARDEALALGRELEAITETGVEVPKAQIVRESIGAAPRAFVGGLTAIPGGLTQLAGTGLEAIGVNAEGLTEAGRGMREGAQEFTENIFGAPGEALQYDPGAQFASDVSGGVGSVGTFLVPGGAARLAGAGKGLVGAERAAEIARVARPAEYGLGTTQGLEQGIQDVEATEARTGEDISAPRAFAAYLLNAGLGATEVGVAARIFERIPVAQRGAAAETVADVVRRSTAGRVDPTAVAQAVGRTLTDIESRALGRIGVRGAEEALQEGGVQLGTNVIARGLYDSERDVTEGVGYAALVGGTVGGGVRGGVEVAQKVLENRAGTPEATALASDPAIRAEFERLATQEVAAIKAANPELDQTAAVKIVAERAEELLARAAGNVIKARSEGVSPPTQGTEDVVSDGQPSGTGVSGADVRGGVGGAAAGPQGTAARNVGVFGGTPTVNVQGQGNVYDTLEGRDPEAQRVLSGVLQDMPDNFTEQQQRAAMAAADYAMSGVSPKRFGASLDEDTRAAVDYGTNKANELFAATRPVPNVITPPVTLDVVAPAPAAEEQSEQRKKFLERVAKEHAAREADPDSEAKVQGYIDLLQREFGPQVTPTPSEVPGAGFKTAMGSTYTVDEGGRTTRTKAERDTPGHEGDFGRKPTSAKTVYVDSTEQAAALSAAGLQGLGKQGARVAVKDGKATLLTWNRDKNRWGSTPSSRGIPVYSEPAVGRAPLELWGPAKDVPGYEAYRKMHAGNQITELFGSAPETAAPAPEVAAPAAPTPTALAAAPDYLVENARGTVDALRQSRPDVLAQVTDLHADDFTAGEIAQQTGLPPETVRDIRLGLGLPGQGKPSGGMVTGPGDMQERAAFEAWRDNYKTTGQVTPAPEVGTATTAPEVEATTEATPKLPTQDAVRSESEYMTDAAHKAAEAILSDFMVGDRVRVGTAPGIVVGLDGDYVRVHPDSAKNPKAYNRAPKASVEFVSRPDNATTVSASKVEGQDAKFGEEAGQLNADMAGLIQLLGANMYASSVAEVSVKELLQNAFDAVKGAVSGRKAPSLYKEGKIRITFNRTARTITIEDNARGMTPEIVRDAFFTVAGSDKSDLDPQDRSGGLGLAKMGFMMGADWLKLDTVRDGVRVTVEATSKEIAGSNFKINKTPANAGEHGTTITVKVPESYIDSKNGESTSIWFPYDKGSVDVLNKPLIGPVTVEYVYDRGFGEPETQTLPMGTNFPFDDYQKLEAKFDWGTADIYYGKVRKKRPDHQVLSSGVYQFNQRFMLNLKEVIPYDIIVNVKSNVEARHPDYPFENSRERFKGRLEKDVKALTGYLVKIARGAEAADLKETMQNVISLPRVEVGEEVKGLETKLKKSFETDKGAAPKPLPETPTQVIIKDSVVTTPQGKVVVDVVKEEEKKKNATFEAKEKAPTKDDFMIELDQDPANPIFHNNTNFDPIAVGTPYGDPAKFFAELGSIFVEMKELLAGSGRYGYDALSPDNLFYAGVAIDKQYGGLHIKVPYKAVLVNPFYDWGARTLPGVRQNILNTMIHELAHTGDMGHGEAHNTEMVKTELYLADEGMLDYFRDAIMDTLLRHESTFTAMRDAYGRSTTQNTAKSLEDYGKEGVASREAGQSGTGREDETGAVSARGGQGGRGDIRTDPEADTGRGERGAGRADGGTEPLTTANVNKVVSVKLTKAQINLLERAAGIQRAKLNAMQKRIARSRSAEETMGLAGKLMLATRKAGEAVDILTSIFPSVPTPVLQALLSPLETADVVRLGKRAGMKNVTLIDNMVRDQYVPYVNRIMAKASKLAEKWADFTSRMPEGANAMADVMVLSNMLDADPSLAPTAAEYLKIDREFKALSAQMAAETDPKRKSTLKGQLTKRRGEIERLYFGGTDPDGTTVAGWNDIPPQGKQIFREARDYYKADFEEHYRLLMQRIDDAQFKPEDATRLKDAVSKMFDQSAKQVIYFPLKRFGDYWVSVGKGASSEFYMFEEASAQDAFIARLKREGETREINSSQGRDTLRLGLRNKTADASSALKNILDLLDDGGLGGIDLDTLKDHVFQMYLTALPEGDMRRRFIHRQFTTGFSMDALRTFASTSIASANQLGRLAYDYKLQNLIDQSFAETEGKPSKRRLDTITRELKLRLDDTMSANPDDFWSQAANLGAKATFLFILTSPASAVLNLTQLHVVGLPTLAAEFGEAATLSMAARYTKDVLTGDRIANPFRDEEGNLQLQMPEFTTERSAYIDGLRKTDPDRHEAIVRAWEYAREREITESTFSSAANVYESSERPSAELSFTQAARQGNAALAVQRATANAVNGMGALFHHTERMGREVMYMSAFEMAYDRALAQGKTPVEAREIAMPVAAELTNKGMFDFSNWNKSRAAKHPVGKLALQMRAYTISMTSLLFRSFVKMLPFIGNTKAEMLAGARVFVGVGAMTTLYGGLLSSQFYLMGMLGFGFLKMLESAFKGDDEEEEVEQGYLNPETLERETLKYAAGPGRELSKKDWDMYIREVWIPDTFGSGGTLQEALGFSDATADKLATVADIGLPGLFKIDISNNVALTNLWYPIETKSDDPLVQSYEAIGRGLLGPSASLLAAPVKMLSELGVGNIRGAVEAVMPAALRGFVKAERLKDEGLVVGKNRDIVLRDPSFYDAYTLAMTSLGFREAETSRDMQLSIRAGEIEREITSAKTDLFNRRYRAVRAIDQANPTEDQIRALREVERDIQIYNLNYPSNAISDEAKQRSYEEKAREAAERMYGLGVNAKIPIRQSMADRRAEELSGGQ